MSPKMIEEIDAERAAEFRRQEKIKYDAMNGILEPPSEVKKSVEDASLVFWSKFDDYVRAVRAGEAARAPSRDRHKLLFLDSDVLQHADMETVLIAEGYWGKLFNQAMLERGIPNNSDAVMGILYRRTLPEGLKLPGE